MAPSQRIILRKVYLWRAALFGLLYGLILGGLFLGATLFGLWQLSQVRGIVPEGITGGDLVFFWAITTAVFVALSAIGSIIAVLLYNIVAKLGGGLHVELEEKPLGNLEQVTVTAV